MRPSSIRATFAGIAAAMGKLGALIGVFMFEAVYISRGMDVVMYCCAVLAALGFALTAVFVDVEQSYSSKSWRARARRRPRARRPRRPRPAARARADAAHASARGVAISGVAPRPRAAGRRRRARTSARLSRPIACDL